MTIGLELSKWLEGLSGKDFGHYGMELFSTPFIARSLTISFPKKRAR